MAEELNNNTNDNTNGGEGNQGTPQGGEPTQQPTAQPAQQQPTQQQGAQTPLLSGADVPDQYDDFKLPEGFEANEAMAKSYGELAKELGLSQEKAQKLVDYYCKSISDRAATEQKNFENWQAEQVKTLKDDADFGGAKFEENIALAKKGLSAVADKTLLEYVNSNFLGSYAPFVKMCAKIGALVSEDSASKVDVSKPSGQMTEEQLADLMFRNN